MADHDRNPSQQRAPRPKNSTCSIASFVRKLHSHAPNSGLSTFFISGSIFLLLLTGVAVTTTIFGLIFFAPLILISSPIWLPMGTVIFISAAGFLSICGFGVVVAATLSWMYRYFKGLNPPGSGRVDHAGNQIYDTASHVKDYAREYGGYLQGKVKDAARGA